MDKWANGPSERRRRGVTTEPQPRPPASSWLLPWICDRQLGHLQVQGDEGTPCPGPSGHSPQPLLEGAPQDCPPSCEMPGPHLPGLPAEGQPGLLCWPLGAEGYQETSGRDPGSSPGKRRKEKSSHWGREMGLAPARVEATHSTGLGQLGKPFPVLRRPLPQCGTHHLNCHILLLQQATLPGSCHCYTLEFSFSTVLFNLLGETSQVGECQGPVYRWTLIAPRISPKSGPSPGLSAEP